MEFDELIKDHRLYHSKFQQDYFITARSGGTVYGMYKQALREFYKRFRGLKELYNERDLLQVDIDEIEFNFKFEAIEIQEFDLRRKKIEYDKKILDMVELNKNIEDTEREFQRFYEQAVTLKEQIGELTDERREQLDEEMWIYKLKEMIAIDVISTGRLKNTTVELLNSIPLEDRKKIKESTRNKDFILEFENQNQHVEFKNVKCDLYKILT